MSNNICSICLEKINSNKKILKCQHTFHEKCILKWFKNPTLKDMIILIK